MSAVLVMGAVAWCRLAWWSGRSGGEAGEGPAAPAPGFRGQALGGLRAAFAIFLSKCSPRILSLPWPPGSLPGRYSRRMSESKSIETFIAACHEKGEEGDGQSI